MADRQIIAFERITDYTNAQESAFSLTLVGTASGGAKIYNTDLQKIRIWDGSQFQDSPLIPPKNILLDSTTIDYYLDNYNRQLIRDMLFDLTNQGFVFSSQNIIDEITNIK